MPFIKKDNVLITKEELSLHNKEDSIWLGWEGVVYDVSDFVEDHPGGKEVMLAWAGKEIDEMFLDPLCHKHSSFALKLLKEQPVMGRLEGNSGDQVMKKIHRLKELDSQNRWMEHLRDDEGFISFESPLLKQVIFAKWTKEHYLCQVHIPRHVKGSPDFFGNFLDNFTKTKWWFVPCFWIPVIAGIVYYYATFSTQKVAPLWLLGFSLWTIYEYTFHRYLFHMEKLMPSSQIAYTIHFLLHGVHHFLPMDQLRLVMPPIMMIALSSMVGFTWSFFIGHEKSTIMMSGSLSGYLIYDMMHYYFHHGKSWSSYITMMKTHHMDHHYVDPNLGFGVSNKIWDLVFGSGFSTKKKIK